MSGIESVDVGWALLPELEKLILSSVGSAHPKVISSPLKWTKDIDYSRFQPTLAVSRRIDSTAGLKRSL